MFENATVRIRVIEACGLIPGDRFSHTSDPYAEVRIVGRKMGGKSAPYGEQRTQTIKRTLAPFWDAPPFVLRPNDPDEDIIEVRVFDYDLITRDDLLGVVSFPVRDMVHGQRTDAWYRMHNTRRTNFQDFGRIHIWMEYTNPDRIPKKGAPQPLPHPDLIDPAQLAPRTAPPAGGGPAPAPAPAPMPAPAPAPMPAPAPAPVPQQGPPPSNPYGAAFDGLGPQQPRGAPPPQQPPQPQYQVPPQQSPQPQYQQPQYQQAPPPPPGQPIYTSQPSQPGQPIYVQQPSQPMRYPVPQQQPAYGYRAQPQQPQYGYAPQPAYGTGYGAQPQYGYPPQPAYGYPRRY